MQSPKTCNAHFEMHVQDEVLESIAVACDTGEGGLYDTYIVNMLFIHRLMQFLFWSGALLMHQSKVVRVLYQVHDVDLHHNSSWLELIEGCSLVGE